MEFSTARFLSDANAEQAHRFSYNVNRTGDDYQTPGSRDDTCLGQRRSDVGSLFDVDRDAPGSLANLRGGRRARIFDVGGDNTVGQRKEYFSDFADGFVAHGSENEHQRAFFVGGGKGRAQGPGSGGIVGDIEDDLRVLGRSGQDLKAAGP